nr:hypothetical protein [Tanacetum cinerariifolium]
AIKFGKPQLDQRQFAEGTGQSAGAQLDSAVPANHQHHHLIEILRFDGRQNRSACCAARLAIVRAAVLRTQFPGPAVVRGALFCSMNAWASAGLLMGAARPDAKVVRRSDRWREPATLEDDADQVVARLFHVLLGQARATGDLADLRGEVSVMLSAAPQQEDEMNRIDRVHFARVDPRLKDGRPSLKPLPVILAEVFVQAFAATDDFHREDARGLWLASGELHLRADVLGQRLSRIVFDLQMVEGAVPQLNDVTQDRDVQTQLVGEVIVQVGFWQPGILRDRVHAGAFESVTGELVLGSFHDRFFILLTNAARRFGGAG